MIMKKKQSEIIINNLESLKKSFELGIEVIDASINGINQIENSDKKTGEEVGKVFLELIDSFFEKSKLINADAFALIVNALNIK